MTGVGERRGKYTRPELTQDNAAKQYAFSDQVLSQLKSLGIVEPNRPRYAEDHLVIYGNMQIGDYFDGRMPVVIRNYTLDDLSSLMMLQQAWMDYISYQHTYWNMKKVEANRQTSVVDGIQRKVAKDNGIKSDQKIRDMAKIHPDYVYYDAKKALSTAMADMLEAQVRITSKNISAVSREVSIREQKLQLQLKQRGFGNKMTRYARGAAREMVDAEGEDDQPVGDFRQTVAPTKSRAVRITDHRKKARG